MILAWLILTLSMAMVFFYFQTSCQKILRRQFEGEPFQSIANVIRLEFPSLRRSLACFIRERTIRGEVESFCAPLRQVAPGWRRL
jgi:hypothetical protein